MDNVANDGSGGGASTRVHPFARSARLDVSDTGGSAPAVALGMTTATRHPRPGGDATNQQTTAVELVFDLVFVFAITRLSQLVLGDLTVHGLVYAGVLLLVLW